MIAANGTGTGTILAITYTIRWAVNRYTTNQFYRYLLARLSTDTIVLLKR